MLNLPLGTYTAWHSKTWEPGQNHQKYECSSVLWGLYWWQTMHVVANGQRKQDMSVVLSGNSSCLAYRVYFLSAEHVDSSWVNANAQRVWELSSKCNTTIATGGKRVSPLFMVSDSFEQICKQFEEHSYFVSISKTFGSGFHGATAVNVTVEPGKESSIPTEISQACFTLTIIVPHYV